MTWKIKQNDDETMKTLRTLLYWKHWRCHFSQFIFAFQTFCIWTASIYHTAKIIDLRFDTPNMSSPSFIAAATENVHISAFLTSDLLPPSGHYVKLLGTFLINTAGGYIMTLRINRKYRLLSFFIVLEYFFALLYIYPDTDGKHPCQRHLYHTDTSYHNNLTSTKFKGIPNPLLWSDTV